ncbi:MAG TPA: double-strand break repair helicase AddA [Methyloceanibacter sp.]|nr:double-strand break repair helicase AddA [Methyloceanibacter sp.]
MSERPPLTHEADANQARASDPMASAWVSANAGTGKTEVLVKRILRLLLAGSRPESILCLTYTKTAAAAMQNRLLKELADWATISTAALNGKLEALTGRPPREEDLRRARRLFASALEAGGGLKIYTIHGFCERLLQRFPLESQLTPHFGVLDERGQSEMRTAALDATIARTAENREGGLGKALAKIIAVTSEDYFRKAVDAVLAKRVELEGMIAYHDARSNWAEAEGVALKHLLGVADGEEDALIAELAGVFTAGEMDATIAAFAAFGSTAKIDTEVEASLRVARTSQGEQRVSALRAALLTGPGEARDKICSKTFGEAEPAIADALKDAQARFAEIDLRVAHLRVAEASSALLVLADAIKAEYERRKKAEAVLDYDDLIIKAQQLLFRAGAAAWVLYKIDGGIDHILVDEAQDTNPAQWTIIERLAEEFFTGEGAHVKVRTLFAVGDEKQSIYSFQGADPARFGAVGRAFRAKARAAQQAWNEVPLTLSFRSTEPVLEAVDQVFAKAPAADGLTSDAATVIKHHAYRKGEAGRVELWEVQEEKESEPAEAFEPWNEDRGGVRSVDALCARIAALIKYWLVEGEELPSAGRKVKAGDILILVRRRDPFTRPMFRALKREGVPVAGADRMRLMDQLAVQDLVALADVLLMPEDDLALAVVLKSPLFGLDDEALFDLAYERETSLWAALKTKAGDDARFAEAASVLARWLSRADFQPPYEFFSELLEQGEQAMRKRLLTRLGPEAAEALDEFLDLALAYDRDAAPSLQGFVDQLRLSESEIKRDMEQERDEVRIMTVHGAKGLQAPIVFLPDTCMISRAQGPRIFLLPRPGTPPDTVGHLVWPPAGHLDLEALANAKMKVQQDEREEYHRLLYVAMTRACDRLYVCGWQGVRQRERNGWYDLVTQGLQGLLTKATGHDGTSVRRLDSEQAVSVEEQAAREPQIKATTLPEWATKPAAAERSREILTPSRLAEALGPNAEQPPLGPKALADNRRFARGRLVHSLLQHLPQLAGADQERAARAFAATRGGDLPEKMREEIVSETIAIVQDPRFAALFQPGSLGEVPIVARFGDGHEARELRGQMDRLAVLDEALLVLDYKTNRPPPSTPEEVAPGYIAQLAAYRAALRLMFPTRALRAAIVWTDGPKLMEIPSTLLDLAERLVLQEDPRLDVVEVRT